MSKRFKKIYIEITNNCNLSCSFCSIDTLPKRQMSVEEFKKVINKIKNYTDLIYLHVKGEPLLHTNLDDILTICDENKIKVCITTNGTLLENRKEILLRHHITKINVSLHCENNYPDYFNKVFITCDVLQKKTPIIYRIWTLSSLELGKNSTNIVENIKNHYNLSTDIVNKIKKEKNIKIADNLYIDKDYKFEWPKINDKFNIHGTCLGTKNHIAILSNGTVVPCCLDSNGLMNLGNILEDSMEKILNSELFINISEGFKNKKITTDLCKSCTYRYRFDLKK